jgi:triosephosphate isomerase
MTLSSLTPRPLIAGNWKMNGLAEALDQARAVAAALDAKPAAPAWPSARPPRCWTA